MQCGMGSPSHFPASGWPPLALLAPLLLLVRGHGERSRLGQGLCAGEPNVPEVPRK